MIALLILILLLSVLIMFGLIGVVSAIIIAAISKKSKRINGEPISNTKSRRADPKLEKYYLNKYGD